MNSLKDLTSAQIVFIQKMNGLNVLCVVVLLMKKSNGNQKNVLKKNGDTKKRTKRKIECIDA